MAEVELEAPPKYIGKLKVIGRFAVYTSSLVLRACCKDIDDAHEVAQALELKEPLIVPLHDKMEHYAGG